MKLETFFKNFDLLADAPNGVQKLRELILQLAVMGKLVPQDANDEPASVLLEKIKFEKEQLVKEGKIKKNKTVLSVESIRYPYKVTSTWEWCIFSDVVFFQEGPGIRNWQFRNAGVKLLNVKNIVKGELILNNSDKYISEEEFYQKYSHFLIEEGDLLFASSGNSWGKTAFFKNLGYKVIVNTSTIRMRFIGSQCHNKYLRYFLDSSVFKHQMIIQLQGMQPNFGSSHLMKVLIPIPPLDEQKRIVAKVDELMALCDRLSERQQKRRSTRVIINNAAIGQLLTARDPEVFNKSWQHICNNFDLLYSTPDNIGKLRQAILQLAVQGKLVPQDDFDEPASVLLEKIRVEKEQLVKEGKIGKSKLLSLIEITELPFKQPSGWEWERFGEIADIVSGVTKGRNLVGRKTAFYPYMRVANVQRGFLDIEVMKEIEIFVEELEKYRLQIGDILLTEGGDWDKLGRSAIWEGKVKDCIHQNHVFRARLLHTSFASQWVVLYTNSPIGRRYFETASKKTTNLASINMTQLRHCPLPIPPLAEQHRIVAKVNQLMSLCDTLETKLTQSLTDSEKLMEAAVRQILAANSNKTDKQESALLESIHAETTKPETKTAGRSNKKTQGQDAEAVQLNLPLF